MKRGLLLLLTAGLSVAVGHAQTQTDVTALAGQVREAERAFAKTMADRNHAAFVSFLADDTIFMGDAQTLRGKAAVAAAWKGFYDAPQAPFSWEPDRVEVLDSGTLALSSGPVRDPAGTRVGTFNSVWRRENGGAWKIVFDKGCTCQ
ncbi:MAG: nuclear transport factor 2 family protein [Acidobacteriia bacterium]|nr:nuclear transport factor 2 family protein [Terriglobia bacterium]